MPELFPEFSRIVRASLQKALKDPMVFVTDVNLDDLYAHYLASFPEGTNPIFNKRSEHECSCCRQFIRRVGAVVTVGDNGHLHTIWGAAADKAPYPYNSVAHALRKKVLETGISNLFCVGMKEDSFGVEKSYSYDKETGRALTWDHFYSGVIPANFRAESPDQVRGDYRTTVQVFERGLLELSPEMVAIVLSMIEANSLYRGQEHKAAVTSFQKCQKEFLETPKKDRPVFLWATAKGPAARFRNTVIGTLVQDLSEGMDTERAVASFEAKVAPTNYKRTTAVITPMMVEGAMKTIQSLDLEPALERRFARITDISVQDVLWVDGSTKPLMKGGLGEILMQYAAAPSKPDKDNAEEISMEDFLRVLPEVNGIEMFLSGKHLGNLMSLTAPVHPEPKHLFRWDNDFAWSYSGGVADSISERVKKAGGKVEGAVLRVSLSWYNFDDLDLHVYQPSRLGTVEQIYFGSKRGWTKGLLDVDMNAGGGSTREPVENIAWTEIPPPGEYKVHVENFSQRETSNVGFIVEVENEGKLSHFTYNKAVRNKQNIHICTLHLMKGKVERIELGDSAITTTAISQDKWQVKTETFVKVNAVTFSPNYWGENAVGNKHIFFLLDGCKSDEPTRGIYNEFLHPRLEPHRRVFELIGDRTQCQPIEGGLSGLGFSSTKKDSVMVRVQQGKRRRLLNIKIA